MENKILDIRERCPLQNFLKMISGKWKLQILEALLPDAVVRYSRFKDIISNINGRALTRALRELVEDGLIQRIPRESGPLYVEYRLTDTGKEVMLALMDIRETILKLPGIDVIACENCLLYEYADALRPVQYTDERRKCQ